MNGDLNAGAAHEEFFLPDTEVRRELGDRNRAYEHVAAAT
jgi:hypothetical protein